MTQQIEEQVNDLRSEFSELMDSENELTQWVEKWREIFQPDQVYFCNGTDEEYDKMCELLVASKTFIPLKARPNSFLARSDPADTARVEDRTFIASKNPIDAGPTNNWKDPDELKGEMLPLFQGSMKGRTMYVIPFCMGPLNSPAAKIGVQLTDSAYVVANMKIMTRMGAGALQMLKERDWDFVPCLHSVGFPLNGKPDVAWPCDPENIYISHFPETKEIWSYGSGYGGNALLGKKCFALRIASTMAKEQGWMAEHMLIIAITSPSGERKYITAAFPSSCGKTNMAMMLPSLPGWKIETIGDDIAWLRIGDDGRLYAINPEAGYFGVAPGTSEITNKNALDTLKENCIFTNVAETLDGDVWWRNLTPKPPEKLIDWQGKEWSAEKDGDTLPAHPNSRFTAPANQSPSYSDEADDPQGVPISAILFGGRRTNAVPLVTQSKDWSHGVFLGSIMSSETTAAATGAVGTVRFDPFAMLPFTGYNMGDYISHWLDVGKAGDPEKMPKLFWVNWFRADEQGNYTWPGFGENTRVLKWILEQVAGDDKKMETPIGYMPTEDGLDCDGMDESLDIKSLISFDEKNWVKEVDSIQEHYEKLGERLPKEMWEHLDQLKKDLNLN